MKIAAITTVYNERRLLPVWLNHYGPIAGYENLYVLDDGSTDGSTADRRIVNLLRKNKCPLDEDDRAALASIFHEELLRHYDIVIYSDVDELIVVDPAAGAGLRAYLEKENFARKTPTGWNVLHRIGAEEALDLSKPLFAQRRFVQCDIDYFKTLIAKVPMDWGPGFHYYRSDIAPEYDQNLFLFHLRAMDHGIATERAESLMGVTFSENSLQKGHSMQFRRGPSEYLTRYFSTPDVNFKTAHAGFTFIDPIIESKTFGEIWEGGLLASDNIAIVPDRFRDTIALNYGTAADRPMAALGARVIPPAEVCRIHAIAINRMIAVNPHRKRNEPCPCGSQKRFRHCHGRK